MKNPRKIFCFCSFLLLFLAVSMIGTAANADMTKELRWSFNFDKYSMSDALRMLSQKTEIQIYFNKDLNQIIINKNFENVSLEQILSGLFFNHNYAVVYSYIGNRLDFIDIFIVGSRNNKGQLAQLSSLGRRVNSRNERQSTLTKIKQERNTRANSSLRTRAEGNVKKSHRQGMLENKKSEILDEMKKPVSSGAQASYNSKKSISDHADSTKLPTLASEAANNNGEVLIQDTPLTVPLKWRNLEPPPMPPGFKGSTQ